MEHVTNKIINSDQNFILLCSVEHTATPGKEYLFVTNYDTYVKEGSDVVVETAKGLQVGVVRKASIVPNDYNSSIVQMMMNGYGAKGELKKILKKIFYTDIKYQEPTTNRQSYRELSLKDAVAILKGEALADKHMKQYALDMGIAALDKMLTLKHSFEHTKTEKFSREWLAEVINDEIDEIIHC